MINFKSIKIQNFMSYGAVPTTIQLDRAGTTLILGEDLDNTVSGSGANGVGKTSVLNALVYALYDQSLSNISKDNLVNNINKKNMEVTVEFEKDGNNYVIVRSRKIKAGPSGNVTSFYENGVDKTLDSSNNTNELIVKTLGIPYELFVRIVAFSATHTPFLDLPVRSHYAANQTDIIEELFDLKTLSSKAEALKEEIKGTEGSLKTHMERMEFVQKEHDRHVKQLESARRRVQSWIESNAQEIEDTKHRIEKLQGIDVEEQRRIYDQLTQVTTNVRDLMAEKQVHLKEMEKLEGIIEHHQNELDHLYKGECPRCKQKYNENQDAFARLELELKEAKNALPEIQEIWNRLEASYIENNNQSKALKKQLQVTKLEDLLEIKNKLEQQVNKLAELQTATNPYTEALEEVEAIVLDDVDMTKINELKNHLDHQNFLLKLLTKKDSFVRKALLNKNIPFLNQRLQKYLTDLGLPHTVEFTHEMTAKISQFGHELDFGNLSNGQRARVNLALSFAFRDVLQSMHEFVNICLLDEALDVGLDSIGVQAAARMLKRKAREEKMALFIISHRDEIDSAFDRKMIVQLSEGFSSIRYAD